MDLQKIKNAVKDILEAIGEDTTREGLVDTPDRVARMCQELFQGLKQDPEQAIKVMFNEPHEEMVMVKDIDFYSMCEHHLLPFTGKAHIVYIPRNNKITGLSKLVRMLDIYSRRPQLQERLTTNIANTLMKKLDPIGVMVVIEAEHMCMTVRGVKRAGAKTITSAVRGCFETEIAARNDAMSLIRG
ncbi:MAG: GTP cyclohydrolase I FolE [Candidatus Muirbacterium halophilum]|nr:GTP cyclohydrolase I FolE [Candidatus Muirbacterium halophilum]MCK9475346.1 GTP cyclohydrolase I FolE [Candidatus Muirbacterium halophilum]